MIVRSVALGQSEYNIAMVEPDIEDPLSETKELAGTS